jgi:hypothetical protein
LPKPPVCVGCDFLLDFLVVAFAFAAGFFAFAAFCFFISRFFGSIDTVNGKLYSITGLGTLRHNYAMQHAMHRASYYKSEQFPVIEYNFPFTVSIDPKNLDMKKQNAAKAKKPAAKAKATTKKSSKKSQPTQTGGLGKNSLFLL